MINPTIGRRVWFWPNGTTGIPTVSGSDQPCDAGICFVWNDRRVNLTVAGHDGSMHTRTSVMLLQDDDPVPAGCYATWMPYQVGQAKQADAPQQPTLFDATHLQPHQQRVVLEKNEVSERLSKLMSFFQGPTFESLPDAERARLRSQARFMDGYAAVLEERIAAF